MSNLGMNHSLCLHAQVDGMALLSVFCSNIYVGGIYVICGIRVCVQQYGHTHFYRHISGLSVTPSFSSTIFLI